MRQLLTPPQRMGVDHGVTVLGEGAGTLDLVGLVWR